ncbi:NAD/NADP octopine/nopaline dehydrogenase family protein [Roseofilum sp. BLCC_M154]|uniref:NAD/NADP octopine/nopaline dehydrogenase family protein n=1 Tax=Roseofilum acuticapitatum BLCC-M154 TaxID=3022444 RepID=A0ABT7AQE5_9CYAN|nr:NAD/NADP octopine/nopaline dehydrogenase family protein [Roseofilum acuticapitatum]MDJ1169128.1 NAD/NADP octopine/nopaline dehydrogenase family protein [Roseofilum acuticapitatum BLCC-M154]
MTSFVMTIVGGGNSGHVLAGLAPQEVETRLLTRRPENWDKTIKVFSENLTSSISEGYISRISSKPEEVIPGSHLIIMCSPVHAYDAILSKIAPYVDGGSHIGSLFGQGCSHFLARSLLANAYFFEFQTIPWICRATHYGKQACIYGSQQHLRVATNSQEKSKLLSQLKTLLGKSTIEFLPNFLSCTLTPSNQIVHPGRYYGIFHAWDGVSPYSESEIPLLYSDMDEFSAKCMTHLSDEIQSIKQEIISQFPEINLDYVKPIKDRLIEDFSGLIEDKTSLKTIWATSHAHRGIKTPVREIDGGFVPDSQTRLFEDDIPYGLCILKGYAEMLTIDTPWIDIIVEWHQKLMGKEFIVNGKLVGKDSKQCGTPSYYGTQTLQDAVI